MEQRLGLASDKVTNVRLDCETRPLAEASLLETFGCSSQDLQCFLTDPGHEAFFDDH
jgi:hypothetical protein